MIPNTIPKKPSPLSLLCVIQSMIKLSSYIKSLVELEPKLSFSVWSCPKSALKWHQKRLMRHDNQMRQCDTGQDLVPERKKTLLGLLVPFEWVCRWMGWYECWFPNWESCMVAGQCPCVWQVHTGEFRAETASCQKKTRQGNGTNVVKS